MFMCIPGDDPIARVHIALAPLDVAQEEPTGAVPQLHAYAQWHVLSDSL